MFIQFEKSENPYKLYNVLNAESIEPLYILKDKEIEEVEPTLRVYTNDIHPDDMINYKMIALSINNDIISFDNPEDCKEALESLKHMKIQIFKI